MPPLPLNPGAVVGGRYRVEALIGQGGFGAVFRATQLALDRPVALKALIADPFDDGGAARFDREAELVQRLEHPNVVRLLDFGRAEGGLPYLVFELLEGHTLEEEIKKRGPLSPPRAARVGAQILKALMAAHARGIVHRDIKPANIFLSHFQGEPDFVKVLDFGIAKAGDSRTLTQKGGVIGTPAYMAPEQVTGGEATPATDLYAVGLTLAEAITGEPVFKNASLVDIVREHLSSTPIPHDPSALRSPLGAVIHRATQKAEERRYRSAAEMLAAIEGAPSGASAGSAETAAAAFTGAAFTGSALTGNALTAPPDRVSAPGPQSPLVPRAPARSRRRRRGPWIAVAVVGGALGLGAALLAVTLTSSGGKRHKPPAAVPAESAEPEAISWLGLGPDGTLAEVDVNRDGVLDFVGYCSDPASQLCAIDGATFRSIWRRPVRLDRTLMSHARLTAAGKSVVYVDPEGIAHLHDAATGAERGAIRLGSEAMIACAPPEHPGKVWIETTEERALLIDPQSKSAANAKMPASCGDDPEVTACQAHGRPPAGAAKCKLGWLDSDRSDLAISELLTEGASGVGFGTAGGAALPSAVGFTLDQAGSAGPRWRRPLGPGNGQTALKLTSFVSGALRGGHAVTAYDDTAGSTHIVALDGATGRTLWDVKQSTLPKAVIPGGPVIVIHQALSIAVTPTRVYVRVGPQLDVRDAATGRVLGSVGHRD